MEKSQELIREIQKGLLQWYDLKEGSLIFYVGEEKEPLAEMLGYMAPVSLLSMQAGGSSTGNTSIT